MSNDVYIISGARTAMGSFLGSLSSVPAPVLGSVVIKAVLERAGVSPGEVDEVLMGCVLPAGQGQAPARQAMIKAGIPTSTGAVTVNKVCGSGLKTVMMAAAEIKAGEADLVIAGGMESMSQSPHYLMDARNGYRMGHREIKDSMILDGLWDPYHDFHMGNAGEMCAEKYHFTREAQDDFAKTSYERARKAIESGAFKAEIVPVEVPQRRKDPIIVDTDEEPFKGDPDKLGKLRAAFAKEGTITAGNASTINDGASTVLVASGKAIEAHGLKPMAKILGSATFSQDPEWFTTAPVGAIKKILAKLSLTVSDIDLFEINEAFSVVTMAAMADLDIPLEKVNVRGGAVALGHPIGASGNRLLVTLLHALKDQNKKRGVVTLCIGGGEAVAVVVEMV